MVTPEKKTPTALGVESTFQITKYFGSQFWQELNSSAAVSETASKAQEFLRLYPSTPLIGVNLEYTNVKSFALILKVFGEQLSVPLAAKPSTSIVLDRMSGRSYCVCIVGLQRLSFKEKLWYWWFRKVLENNNHVVYDDFSWR